MPDAHPRAVEQRRDQRRPRPAQRRIGVGDIGEPLRSGVHRGAESAEQVDVLQVDPVERGSTSAIALIATALATSPCACPPMPSATARRRELV